MGLFNFGKDETDTKSGRPEAQEAVSPVHAVTNDELLSRWRSFSVAQSDANMGAFLEEMVEHSQLITLVLSEADLPLDDQGRLDQEAGLELQFPLLTTEDQKVFQPVFTDWQVVTLMLEQWRQSGNDAAVAQAQGVVIDFDQLIQLIQNNEKVKGTVINPFADNITLDRDSLLDLQKQRQERKAAQDAPVQVGDAEDVPEGLLETLADQFTKDGRIKRAWMRSLTMNQTQGYFLIVDMPELPDDDELFAVLSRLTKKYFDNPDDVTIGRYTENLAAAVEGNVPFYAN